MRFLGINIIIIIYILYLRCIALGSASMQRPIRMHKKTKVMQIQNGYLDTDFF